MEQLESSASQIQGGRSGNESYFEKRILAGFLRSEDLPIVYPLARCWSETVAARVGALHGNSRAIGPRPEAGQCRLVPVEEPEALPILRAVSQALPFGSNGPVSYSWVDIRNLIATCSVADPFPQRPVVFSADPGALARYSLFGPPPVLEIRPDGTLYSQTNLDSQLVHCGFEGNALVLKYQLAPPPEPILVGYEQGRYYLLTAYSRVIQALIGNVERLLCLVYYGLDLRLPNFGVRIINEHNAVNHFGPALLSGEMAPLVRDFLDDSLTAVVPSRRGEFFIGFPSFQLRPVNWPEPPHGPLPLSFSNSVEER